MPTWQLAAPYLWPIKQQTYFKPAAHQNRNSPRDQLFLSIVHGNNCFKTFKLKHVGRPAHLQQAVTNSGFLEMDASRPTHGSFHPPLETWKGDVGVAALLCLIPAPLERQACQDRVWCTQGHASFLSSFSRPAEHLLQTEHPTRLDSKG